MTNKIFSALKVVTLAIALSFGLSYVYAWTAPSTTPPTGNVSAPINTGADLQSKSGGLTVKNFIADTVTVGGAPNTGAISSPKFCIGASCITAWPAVGGGGTVTSLSAGTGITLSPNPITTTGTITNSGVTSLVAGTNITLSPAGGTGAVTVGAVGSTNVYDCPIVLSNCGYDHTCDGGLSSKSTCRYQVIIEAGGSYCVNSISMCAYAGKLMP